MSRYPIIGKVLRHVLSENFWSCLVLTKYRRLMFFIKFVCRLQCLLAKNYNTLVLKFLDTAINIFTTLSCHFIQTQYSWNQYNIDSVYNFFIKIPFKTLLICSYFSKIQLAMVSDVCFESFLTRLLIFIIFLKYQSIWGYIFNNLKFSNLMSSCLSCSWWFFYMINIFFILEPIIDLVVDTVNKRNLIINSIGNKRRLLLMNQLKIKWTRLFYSYKVFNYRRYFSFFLLFRLYKLSDKNSFFYKKYIKFMYAQSSYSRKKLRSFFVRLVPLPILNLIG